MRRGSLSRLEVPEHLVVVRIQKAIVLRLAAGRQLASHGGDALNLPAKLDLFGEQPGARVTIFGAVAGKRLACLGG
jgi:uncharacterized protein YjlB